MLNDINEILLAWVGLHHLRLVSKYSHHGEWLCHEPFLK